MVYYQILFWIGIFALEFLIGYFLFTSILKKKKGTAVNILLFLLVSLGLLSVGEITIRTRDFITGNVPFFHSISSYYDENFGWKGKQIFGDAKTKKFKILIVGDSFTDGAGLAEGAMYYRSLQSENVELFVYGGRGYGTLQEFLVIDRYFDQIRPDMVILQVCSNDFINNLWELESRSYSNNNQLVRPYWINGSIHHEFPRPFGRIRVFLSTYSRLGQRFFDILEAMNASLVNRGFLHTIEVEIREKDLSLPMFQDAVRVTDLLIKKMKERIGNTPLIAFPVDADEPYFRHFKRLFKENDVPFFAQIPEIIRLKEAESGPMRLQDGGHWNANAHALCGRILLEFLGRGLKTR